MGPKKILMGIRLPVCPLYMTSYLRGVSLNSCRWRGGCNPPFALILPLVQLLGGALDSGLSERSGVGLFAYEGSNLALYALPHLETKA